jgi:hypothetical protein
LMSSMRYLPSRAVSRRWVWPSDMRAKMHISCSYGTEVKLRTNASRFSFLPRPSATTGWLSRRRKFSGLWAQELALPNTSTILVHDEHAITMLAGS